MIYGIPLIGWILGIFVHTSMAVPFWFLWTVCGIGQVYFYWLPEIYHDLPFFHCIGLFVTISILKKIVSPILSSSSSSTGTDKKAS